VVLVLVLGIVAAAGLFSSDPQTTAGANTGRSSAPAANTPLIEVQEFKDNRGITINVPKNWTKTTNNGGYTDFTDPNDRNRRLRINSEGGKTAQNFLEVAEGRLKSGQSSCADPYARVQLREIQLDGREGAELEYTCGSGDQQRHALWGAVVVGNKSYHFFLTVPESKFEESKIIYQEMARSFKVAPGQ
jgi:hypothetical protein